MRLRRERVRQVGAEALLRRPGNEAFRVDGTGQMGVEIAALRHAVEEGAQLGMVAARGFESRCGGDGVEIARDERQANDDDDGRQQAGSPEHPQDPRAGRFLLRRHPVGAPRALSPQ